jgi:hemerythrin-like domain-containing protein
MIEFRNRICQTLHEEHQANVALLERVERLIAAHRGCPVSDDPVARQLLSEFATGVSGEVEHHFGFEERGLFPYLDALGNSEISVHLTEEHLAIRPLVAGLAVVARAAAGRGFDEGSWNQFRRLGGELCDRMLSHIQKEEMMLLPLIEENMDSETESRLYQGYTENA